MLADRIIGSFWKLRRSGRMENELYVSLMGPGYSEDIITEEKPYEIILGCTNPDGSKYVGSHYSVSKSGDVKDLLKEPQAKQAETADPKDSVRSLGSMALQDFTSGNILSRFRRYEGQIERSLYKALTELQRLQWLRNRNDPEI